MAHPQTGAWRVVAIGPETALQPDTGRVTVLFGVGPPRRAADRRRRAAALLGSLQPVVRSLLSSLQVHSADLLSVTGESPPGVGSVGPGDGLITTEPRVGLMIWTADCVPVVLAGRLVVAALHVGWRGAAAGIIPAALERCMDSCGEHPRQLTAHLGPAISGKHYPVGPEVIDRLRAQNVPEERWREGDRVDLRQFVATQLAELGIERVMTVGGCTATDPALASFRRDGVAAGRQWSLAYRHD